MLQNLGRPTPSVAAPDLPWDYWMLRRWLPRWGGLYVLAALLATRAPGFEVFPVFCWFLFPIVPGDEPRYELVVEQLNGVPIEPARDIQQLGRFRDPMAMDLWLATQTLGQSLARGNPHSASQATIETAFLCRDTRYRIDEVRYDPLDRYTTGNIEERKALLTVDSEAQCEVSPWAAD